jgi:glycosyltransferase involved in cell wall biosynthesis
MRVLLVTHYSLPHVGGIEVVVDQLGRALCAQGHDVTLVTSRAGASPKEAQGPLNIVRVPAWNGLERRLHVPYPLFAPSLMSTMHRLARDADVIHAHGLLYLSSLAALFSARHLTKPLVVTEHVGFVHYRNPLLNALEHAALAALPRPLLERADAVIALNSRVHAWLASRTPHPERLHFVPNGVDTERFRPPVDDERRRAREWCGVTATKPVALFAGRFVEKKGLSLLLAARDDRFQLLLCGSGHLPELPPDDRRVHVLRDVPHERMPDVYRAADLFLLTSHGEGFPLSVMEAMASGLPVVATRDDTYAHYVSDVEMLQVDADAASLRAALIGLLHDEADRQRRGAAARARALRNFTLAACTERHLAIYEQAVRRTARS